MKALGTALLLAASLLTAPTAAHAAWHPAYHKCTPVYSFDQYVIAKPGTSCALARAVEVNEPGSSTMYYWFGQFQWARQGPALIYAGQYKGAYITMYWRRYVDGYWPAVMVQTWPGE